MPAVAERPKNLPGSVAPAPSVGASIASAKSRSSMAKPIASSLGGSSSLMTPSPLVSLRYGPLMPAKAYTSLPATTSASALAVTVVPGMWKSTSSTMRRWNVKPPCSDRMPATLAVARPTVASVTRLSKSSTIGVPPVFTS